MKKRLDAFSKVKRGLAFLKRNIFSGITRRWLTNVFGTILLASIIMIVLFCMFARGSFYNMAKSRLKTDAMNIAHYYSSYISTASFDAAAHQLVADFEDKDLMEIQISDVSGNVTVSSSGFAVGNVTASPDLVSARDGVPTVWVGRMENTDEKIMSYSAALLDAEDSVIGTVRLITTMTLTDKYLWQLYLIATLVGLFIIAITAVSGIYFIKSIVVPVNEINGTAHAISKGNMAKRIEKYNKSDEIGALCSTINAMAEELSETERVKNDFISSVSHELRTPLTAIRGWSETMMATDAGMDDTTRRGVGIIYKETERLSKLVEDLLDSTRIRNGRFKLVVSPMDLVAEFEDTVFMMMERAKIEDVSIEYTPSLDTLPMLGDKNRLKQVFFNIIDNAIKHSDHGSSISSSMERNDDTVTIIITDRGEGISKEDLPYVKEMFYKGHSQKRGSGIGLGVSDEIVKMHGGSLDIESELGKGTRVTITLNIEEPTPPKTV